MFAFGADYDVRANLSHARVEGQDHEYIVEVGAHLRFLVNLYSRGKVTAFVADDGGVKEVMYREYLITELVGVQPKITPYFTRFRECAVECGLERVVDEALAAMVESGHLCII